LERNFVRLIVGTIIFLLCIIALESLINNLQNIDRDSDGLKDCFEKDIGINPNYEDSDYDYIQDGDEYDYWNERKKNEDDADLGP